MFDAAKARRLMVDGQVRTADVTDPELLSAMLEVPREQFVPATRREQAYYDSDIEIAKGRALLRPMVLGKLIQALHVEPQDKVLDVGCGFGYSSAVLARLAGSVVALEQEGIAQRAQAALAGTANVSVVTGPLAAGWPAQARYDVILINGAVEILPEAFPAQIAPTGRLACIRRDGPASKAMIYRLAEGKLVGRPIFDAWSPVIPGFGKPPAFVF